jgi:hypothetical protein
LGSVAIAIALIPERGAAERIGTSLGVVVAAAASAGIEGLPAWPQPGKNPFWAVFEIGEEPESVA